MDRLKKYRASLTVKLITITILLFALICTPFYYPADVMAVPQHETEPRFQGLQSDPQHENPVMKPSREKRREWAEQYKKAPKVNIDEKIERKLEASPGGSLSLLSHLQYTPSERSQGSCGNCWAWTGTGVMEIALSVQNGIKDRLSVQYLNSNFEGGSGADWACCGGWLSDVSSFYSSTGKCIPWSNTNASYADGSRTCASGSTSVPASSISTIPCYEITSISTQTIATQTVSQSTAIANIKNVLNQNRAVHFSFFLPTESDWQNFRSFWNNQPESAIWDPDYSCGHTWDSGGGGHAVLCVGYNDDDPNPANHYWLMLNSWGTASGNRPNGLFRLAMDMNYACTYQDQGTEYSFFWQTLDIGFGTVMQEEKLIGAADTAHSGIQVGNVLCLVKWQAQGTGAMDQVHVKCGGSGNIKIAIYADSNGSPGTLLNAVNTSTPVSQGWNIIPFPSTPVTQNSYYWLAFISDSSAVYYVMSSGRQTQCKSADYSGFSFSNPAGSDYLPYTTFYYLQAGFGNTTPPTPTPPTITNSTGESDLTSTSARLNGEVINNGNENPTVYIFWGTTDGETNPDNWDHSINLGIMGAGTFYTDITDLIPDTNYYYRCFGTNSAGNDWADTSVQFHTPPPTEKLIGAANTAHSGIQVGNVLCLVKWQAQGAGAMDQVHVKCGGSGNIKIAIYADNNGSPGTLLNAINTSTPVSQGWNIIPFPSTPVIQNSYYWLAFISDSSAVYYVMSSGRQTQCKSAAYPGFSFPNPAGSDYLPYTTFYYLQAGFKATELLDKPNPPDLLSADINIIFRWSAVNNATKYHLQVNTQADFNGTDLFNAEVGNVTEQEVSGLLLGTSYYWRVAAGNEAGWSDWSEVRSILINSL